MKGFTRLTAITLSLAMIIASMFSVGVFADAITFTDVAADYQYNQAIYSLVAKGIINGYTEADGTSTFKPENTITRAEFAKLLVLATTTGVTHTATTDKFPDLTLDHWANTYIAAAVNTGAINGYEDGTFRPENPVSYGEAVKMIVCTLGYASIVTPTEPWYDGYIRVATSIGLLKGAAGLGSNEAKRGLVAQLIYNVNNTKKLVQTGTDINGNPIYSSGGKNSGIGDDYTEEMSGIVTGVFEDTLEGITYNLNKEQIMIDDEVFYIGEYEIDAFYPYLGREIDIEYEDGTKKIITDFEEGSNKTLTVKDIDIDTVNGREITYYEENKKEELTLATDLYVVYNGRGVEQSDITDAFIEQYLTVDSGEITFLNNDGKSDYDVAFVTSYQTMFVKGKSENTTNNTYTIYDEDGNDIILKNSDCTVYKVTTAGGQKTAVTTEKALSTIAANSVVSIAAPLDQTEGTEVVVSTVKLTGKTVESVSSYDITISGEDYEYSAYYNALVAKDSGKYEAVKGDTGTFYFDFLGRLVYYSKSQTTEPYGYLASIDDGGSTFGSSVTAYIFKQDGKWLENVPLAERVSVNGSKVSQSEAVSILETTAAIINADKPSSMVENADVAQLIKYRYENGEITAIYTISPDASNLENGNVVPGSFIADANTETEKTPFTKGTTMLKYTSPAFKDNKGNSQFQTSGSTIIFYVPYDRTADLDDYKKVGTSSLNKDSSYLVEPYDISSNTAKVVLRYLPNGASDAKIYANAVPMFIESISTKTNSDGDSVEYITYYQAGSTSSSTIYASKRLSLSSLGVKPGDVVKWAKESDGSVYGIQKVFVDGQLYEVDTDINDSYATKPATSNHIVMAYNTDDDYYEVVYGTVDSIDTDEKLESLSIVAEGETSWESYGVSSSTKFYMWNDDGKTDPVFETLEAEDAKFKITTIATSTDNATKILAIKVGGESLKAVYILE